MDASTAPRLLDRVRAAVRIRHYGLRTERTYVFRVRRFVRFRAESVRFNFR